MTKAKGAELKSAFKTRKYLRQKITLYSNKVLDPVGIPGSQAKDYINKLNVLKLDINDINIKISSLLDDSDSDQESKIEQDEEYDDLIYQSLEKLELMVPQSSALPNGPATSFNDGASSNRLKLPAVALPEFSNDKTDNLEKFFYSFESIINKHNLSPYEKFVHLKSQLKKAPKILVESLESNEQTYDAAKKLLTDAFASPVTQKFDCIKRLTDLTLKVNDDPYNYIGEMRSIVSSFKALNIDTDTILQYFFWNGLNEKFQSTLIQITNNSKPSLDEINENIFRATERYLKLKESRGADKKMPTGHSASALSTNVKIQQFVHCNLCKADGLDANHKLRDCPIYDTSASKFNKLKELGHCTKCSFSNHKTNNCKFKFASKCKQCGRDHMTYLCLKNNKVMSNLSYVQHSNVSHDSEDIVLPTFTAQLVDVNDCNLRVLKDSGSQRNFLAERTYNKFKFPIVKQNVNIDIHGFNSVKKHCTKIVSIPLIINNNMIDIEAIVVPKLDIKFKIPHFDKITRTFKEKGYKLADIELSSFIDNFDIVMGPEADQILLARTIPFGKNSIAQQSHFLCSDAGVLLSGSANLMASNLEYLPQCSQTENINCTKVSVPDLGVTQDLKRVK